MSAAPCPDPTDRVNGMRTFTRNSFDDTVTYTCIMGFELIGNVSIMCAQVDVNSEAFSPAAPVCRHEYCMNIPIELLHVCSYMCTHK